MVLSDYMVVMKNTKDKILILKDLDLGRKSITNDMEEILEELSVDWDVDFAQWKIAYEDSMGKFTGVKAGAWGDVSFYDLAQQTASDVYTYFETL